MARSFNVIGDIHGSRHWEKLVDPQRINIFVGDYFDPYDDIPFQDLKENFLDIILFAKTNPGTVLLMGNHDLHYIYGEESSRYIHLYDAEIRKLFLDNIHMFTGIAYDIDNKILITHAGVTKDWLETCEYQNEITPHNIAEYCNTLFWQGYSETSPRGWSVFDAGLTHFRFNGYYSDHYGVSPTQGPTWIRPRTLLRCNALSDYVQVVGHTMLDDFICNVENLWFVDCLRINPGSLYINVEDDKITYKINEIHILDNNASTVGD